MAPRKRQQQQRAAATRAKKTLPTAESDANPDMQRKVKVVTDQNVM